MIIVYVLKISRATNFFNIYCFLFKLGSRNNTSNGEHSSFGPKHVSDTPQ